MKRRTFVVSSAAVGTTLLAGCSQSDDGGPGPDGTPTPDDGSGGGGSTLGTFRLLISDQPTDISDFDSLEVTLSRARVFSEQGGEETPDGTATPMGTATPTSSPNGTATPNGTVTPTTTPANQTVTPTTTPTDGTATPTAAPDGTATPTETGTPTDTPDESEEDGESRGFEVFDLGGQTVELTELVGDKALPVLETELEAGTYNKIELYASGVEGIVDGESVDVKIPSEKLQIVKPFEVEAGGEVSFVFDINVVKKGNQGYNLLPVIAKSGVVGKDVEVEEVDDSEDTETPEDEPTETPEDEPTETPEDEPTETPTADGDDSDGGQNESAGD